MNPYIKIKLKKVISLYQLNYVQILYSIDSVQAYQIKFNCLICKVELTFANRSIAYNNYLLGIHYITNKVGIANYKRKINDISLVKIVSFYQFIVFRS